MTISPKKGVALLWVTIVSGIMLIIAGTMVSYIVKESQFSVRTDQSSQAYAYAKSGIDWANKYVRDNHPTTVVSTGFDFSDSNSDNDVSITITPKGGACLANYCIRSMGMVGSVTRTLEYEVWPANLSKITPPSPPGTPITDSNRESFSLQFDFWLADNNTSNYSGTVFGLTSSSGTGQVLMQINNATGKILLADSSGTVDTGFSLDLDNRRTDPYRFRAKIRYIKDTAASLTVFRRNSDGTYTCVGSATKNLLGVNLGNLNILKMISSGTYIASGGSIGDGEYLQIVSPLTKNLYIDNIMGSFIASSGLSYAVVTPVSPAGRGTVLGAGIYQDDTVVNLEAQNTTSGFLFSNWSETTSGSCPASIVGSTLAKVSFVIHGNVSCTANYIQAPVLSVTVNSATYGTAGDSGTYPGGKIVSLWATPAPGYAFSNWSGVTCPANLSTANPVNITMPKTVPSLTSCRANFYATVPVYKFVNWSLEYFFSTDSGETGGNFYTYIGEAWKGPSSSFPGSISIVRYVNKFTGRHFFVPATSSEITDPWGTSHTITEHPVDAANPWHYEGPTWYAFPVGTPNRRPVCRYRHPTVGDAHLWSTTCNTSGLDGYTWEGEAWRIP